MNLTPNAHAALHRLLTAFAQGTIPEALARTVLPALDVPCARWSFTNRLLTWLAGTTDARGLRQWNAVGRRIIAGRPAFYILAPLRVKRTARDPDPEAPEDPEPKLRLVGFRATPVFRVEDTEGAPLAYPPREPPQPPPLWEVAEHWGLTVSYAAFGAETTAAYGSYAPGSRRIVLATHDEQVFFHELAHAAHQQVQGQLHGGQHWRQEVVAELTAATLMHLYGRQPPNDGAAYQYIAGYAQRAGLPAARACLAVLGEVERCLQQLLDDRRTPGARGLTCTASHRSYSSSYPLTQGVDHDYYDPSLPTSNDVRTLAGTPHRLFSAATALHGLYSKVLTRPRRPGLHPSTFTTIFPSKLSSAR